VLPKDRTFGGGLVQRSVTEALQSKAIPCHHCNALIDRIGYNRDVIHIIKHTNEKSAILRTLLDTGSLQGSYVNQEALRTLNELGITTSVSDRVRVCGAVGGCLITSCLPIIISYGVSSTVARISITSSLLVSSLNNVIDTVMLVVVWIQVKRR
jgi:hypothetical protein